MDSKYMLPHDAAEGKRLEEQHNFFKANFRNAAFPSEVKLQPGARILESAAGMGIWALEAAAAAPQGSTMTAFDISSRLFPSSPPPNVTFFTHSVQSLPEEWTSTFDLAHQRLLLFALGKEDWEKALRELYRVLKPGGMLVLDESSGVAIVSEGTDLSQTMPRSATLFSIVKGAARARGCLMDCARELPVMVKQAGFDLVSRETKAFALGPGDIGEESRVMSRAVYAALAAAVVQAGVVKSTEEWMGFLRLAEEEMKRSDLYWEFYVLVARKPL